MKTKGWIVLTGLFLLTVLVGCSGITPSDNLVLSSKLISADVSIYFLNGYNYPNPTMWFWQEESSGKSITNIGTTNIGNYTFDKYLVHITNAGNFHFKFYSGSQWEDAIVSETNQRKLSISNSVSYEFFSVSYNRNVFQSASSLESILSNAPYNLTNQWATNYIYPGAQPVTGGYLFSVFGTMATSANVAGTFNAWSTSASPMKFDPYAGLWWRFDSNPLVGQKYKFVLNSSSWLGDPYGRSFESSSDHNSLLVSTNYTWNDGSWSRPSKDKLVIYETHVKDFSRDDTSVSIANRGKFSGMIEKLSYFTNLGINAVELMPIQEWKGGWYSWGYNNCGFFAPENSYSTNADNGAAYHDFKVLVDKLHQAGVAVILDVVYNHIANDDNYFWTIDSDYFFDPAGTLWGNKTQLKAPLMQKYFIDNMKYWMDEFHVDGFRFDSTENIDIDSLISMIDSLRSHGYSDRYFILEEFNGSHNTSIQAYNNGQGASALSSWGTGYKDTVWDDLFGSQSKSLGDITYYSHSSGWNWPASVINYYGSHDEGTLAGRWNATKQQVKVAATHLLTAMGTPMIWMGDEFMRLHYGNYPPTGSGTDEANNIIDWTLTVTNADLIDYYKNLITLRINHPALHLNIQDPATSGNFGWLTADWNSAIGYYYKGISGDNDFVILANYQSTSTVYSVTFPSTGTWYTMCNGTTATNAAPGLSSFTAPGTATNVTVPAYSAYIYMSQVVN